MWRSIVVLLGLLVTACIQQSEVAPRVPKEVLSLAENYMDLMLKGESNKVKRMLSPEFSNEKSQVIVDKQAELLKKRELVSAQLIDYYPSGTEFGIRHQLTYQLQFKDGWVLSNILVDQVENMRLISGSRFKSTWLPVQEINKFTFEHKGWKHYAVIIWALVSIGLVAYAFWRLIWAKVPRKWLWFMLIFVGIGTGVFNWTTGEMTLKVVSIHIPIVKMYQTALYTPYQLSLSLPLGAIAFLMRRKRLEAVQREKKV